MRPFDAAELVELPARTVYRLEHAEGMKVECLTGNAWITQADDPRDIVLRAGEAFILDRPGLTLVMALKDAALRMEPSGQPNRLAA